MVVMGCPLCGMFLWTGCDICPVGVNGEGHTILIAFAG